MLKTVNIDGKTFIYEFERKNIKNINLHIRRDGSVYLSAPRRVSEKRAEDFLRLHKDFVFKAEKRAEKYAKEQQKKESFSDGSEKILFGDPFYIKALNSDKSFVKIEGNIVLLYLKDSENAEKRRNLFDGWVLNRFRKKLSDICYEVYKEFEMFNFDFPEIKVRKMVSRWGSCNASKHLLTFNTKLSEYSEECIKYVVYHEFCHFVYPNHSKNFYLLLSRYCPEWKKYREILNNGDD